MDNGKNIIDMTRHPIDDLNDYAIRCRGDLKTKSLLILNKFLTKEALLELKKEAKSLQDRAFYCSQNHNVLNTNNNSLLKDNNQ